MADDQQRSLPLALGLAFAWGALWASFLQFTELGRWLADKRTWTTVVAGVGVDLLIALLVVPRSAWLRISAIITASSIAIIARSLINEYNA